MSDLVRFSISMEQSLCKRLDGLVKRNRYVNRSEFIRDLIRDQLVEQEWRSSKQAVGTITLVYDHHTRGLSAKLVELQHNYHSTILASTHVHIDHDNCMEVIILKGKSADLKKLADLLRQQKGVLKGDLSIATTGKGLN